MCKTEKKKCIYFKQTVWKTILHIRYALTVASGMVQLTTSTNRRELHYMMCLKGSTVKLPLLSGHIKTSNVTSQDILTLAVSHVLAELGTTRFKYYSYYN